MKKIIASFVPLFSLDLVVSKTEYATEGERAFAEHYEDSLQTKEDKLVLTKHNGEFVLIDSATGRIDSTEKNYAISKRAIKAFEAKIAKMLLEETEVLPTTAVLSH